MNQRQFQPSGTEIMTLIPADRLKGAWSAFKTALRSLFSMSFGVK